MLKISIITVTKNSAFTIERTVRSVAMQRNVQIEHVIKDAHSTDGTVTIAKTINPDLLVLTQADTGIYDAMNQGFAHSTGDIVAFLNSDDYYIDDSVLSDVVDVFIKSKCDFVYGDIQMTSLSGHVVRNWKTGKININGLNGQQIPHPALFIKRSILAAMTLPFDPSYQIAADLKQQLILINKLKCKGAYIERTLVVMETGGESTNSLASYYKGWQESVQAYNDIFGNGGLMFVVKKVSSKLRGMNLMAQITHFGK